MKSLLVLEDNTINVMMQDPRIMALLPCLNESKKKLDSIKKGGSHCQRCQYEKKRIRANATNGARNCVKSIRGENLQKLKQIMGVKQFRLLTKNTGGQTIKYTF